MSFKSSMKILSNKRKGKSAVKYTTVSQKAQESKMANSPNSIGCDAKIICVE